MSELSTKAKAAIALGSVAILGICVAVVLSIFSIRKTGASITYSDKEHTATIVIGGDDVTNSDSDEYGKGAAGETIEKEDIQTVEEIESEGPVVEASNGEDLSVKDLQDGEEHGLGAFIWAPTESPSAFKNYTLGKCLNTDGAYGAQCWDLADVFWQNYAGRRAQTCGTGTAKGMIQDGCWQINAGDDFEMVWDATKIQPGDWLIFTNGTWGHVGMALGNYNNGYVTLLGQNQGGSVCEQGGSATNIINISLKNFGGAFRPKSYIIPEPTPEPTPTPTPESKCYIVKQRDTLGQIILNLGWLPEGEKLFGDDGFAQTIATKNKIENRGLIYPGQEICND